jgi:hypothetical protein
MGNITPVHMLAQPELSALDSVLALIRENRSLTSLSLADNTLVAPSSTGLKQGEMLALALEANHSLTALDLSRNGFGLAARQMLAKSAKFEQLAV